MLQIGIEPFLGIELRAIAGQVKKLNLILPFCPPSLDQFAVMHPQVIQDQEDFFARIFYQSLQKFNQLVGIKGLFMIIQRVLPWLVTVAIMESFWRVPPTAIATGVLPAGAKLLPRTSVLTSAVSSPQ